MQQVKNWLIFLGLFTAFAQFSFAQNIVALNGSDSYQISEKYANPHLEFFRQPGQQKCWKVLSNVYLEQSETNQETETNQEAGVQGPASLFIESNFSLPILWQSCIAHRRLFYSDFFGQEKNPLYLLYCAWKGYI